MFYLATGIFDRVSNRNAIQFNLIYLQMHFMGYHIMSNSHWQTGYISTLCIKPVAPQKNNQHTIISFNLGLSFKYNIAAVTRLQIL